MSITQLTETILRGQQKAAERQRQEELDAKARRQEEAAKYQSRIQASGLPEWMLEYLSVDFNSSREEWWYTLTLPNCAPITFTTIQYTHTQNFRHYNNVGVRVANEVRYEPDAEEWYLHYNYTHLPRMEDLDEAIALAANEGESWHIMQTEVDHRNAERLRPEPQQPTTDTKPENKPPEIKLDKLLASAYSATQNNDSNGITFALLAIATEIKYLRLTLEIQRDDETAEA